jgi:DNA repair photolyase
MPFRWTINPYRGCSHACVYCLSGDTPILMADGRARALRDVAVGDRIYGTELRGTERRYAETEVLAHWTTVKEAFRVTLADGRELVASGDHRFLTPQGWAYVAGSADGVAPRLQLTPEDTLMGTGPLEPSPEPTLGYRRGYLCGLIRGDGQLGSRSYRRAGRSIDDHGRFHLALADGEALDRARVFLDEFNVVSTPGVVHEGGGRRGEIGTIGTSVREQVETIRALISWPTGPDDDWRRGFLAGAFDADGASRGGVRISTADSEIVSWTISCLQRLGFVSAVERATPAGTMDVRVHGGLAETLRFLSLTDPAVARKGSIEGLAVESDAALDVASIERLGTRMELFDMTTGTGDFVANGVVSHNCFARPTHKYLDLDPGRDFEREIVVKVNAPEVLRAELARPSWGHEHVALGTNTDPYQWVEGRYRLMRGIWEALRDSGTPCSVLTKSPLLLRDLDLMTEIHERAGFAANLSVPTIDEKAWRATEPHTPHPRKRLEAVAELNRAGIPCGVLIAPLMPGINDDPRQVERILALAAEAGATEIGGICLHLRGDVRKVFMDWLRSQRPDLVSRYEKLYARGGYAPKGERRRLAALARPASRVGPRARFSATDAPVVGRDPAQEASPLVPMPRRPQWPRQTALF